MHQHPPDSPRFLELPTETQGFLQGWHDRNIDSFRELNARIGLVLVAWLAVANSAAAVLAIDKAVSNAHLLTPPFFWSVALYLIGAAMALIAQASAYVQTGLVVRRVAENAKFFFSGKETWADWASKSTGPSPIIAIVFCCLSFLCLFAGSVIGLYALAAAT